MTEIPGTLVVRGVMDLPVMELCHGPHEKGEDWPRRFTSRAILAYFDVPRHEGHPLRIIVKIPLCDKCRSIVVD